MEEKCKKCNSINLDFPEEPGDCEFIADVCEFDEVAIKKPYQCDDCGHQGEFIYVQKECLVKIT